MMTQQVCPLDIALLHHPVLNKNGETIGSAVTNLDLHDIARCARTYGVKQYYIATPYTDQFKLIEEIVEHWQNGFGARANPARKEALAIIRPMHDLDEIIDDIIVRYGKQPLLVTTSARPQTGEIGYQELRAYLHDDRTPVLLIFGTAHGLAPEIMKRADKKLVPIQGNSTYNHLSVRSAASIILDRLLGTERY